jgi:HK97 family phage major capsid protein
MATLRQDEAAAGEGARIAVTRALNVATAERRRLHTELFKGARRIVKPSLDDIDKLKSGDGEYLWRNGMTAGAPPSLLGRPVEFSEDMPAIGSNTFPIAFADWRRAYVLVDKLGVRFLRDPFTDKPHVVFYGYRRTGGAMVDFDALKLMKVATS